MTQGLVQRLLGPDRAPLSCEQCFDTLDLYVEWRLAGAEATFERCPVCNATGDCARERDCLAMRAHLESCPACDEEHTSLRDLVVADRTLPPNFRKRGSSW